ncbi:MAG TPA: type II toxin-antitoxin system HicA family toxin [Verrucomicrobiae bacterium]|jgi:predicted RNA binding protein YcfA (HicA-like mRNA interferase family)|nr:type II toxin-antitoxin system HicA family toxin [Verrucomicrobiae bacterium]
MPKLYSSRHIVSVLEKHGFIKVAQKGNHAKYRKSGNPALTAIVPANKKEIPFGTFRSIVRQARLKVTDFK